MLKVCELQWRDAMFDSTVLEKFRKMTDTEKVQALIQVMHADEPPLSTILTMMAILEPDRVEGVFARLVELKA